MKPDPGLGIQENQAIFNYRLSRARRVLENGFSLLADRWRVFMQPIQTTVENTEIVVKATICLHDFLHHTNSAGYCPTGFGDSWDKKGEIKEGEWRSLVAESQSRMLTNIPPIRRSRLSIKAVGVRENSKSYVNSMKGSVSWQWGHVRSRGAIR